MADRSSRPARRASERQLDILLNDDVPPRKWETTTAAIDGLNRKYGRTLVSVGPWASQPDGLRRWQDQLYAHPARGGLLVNWKTDLNLSTIGLFPSFLSTHEAEHVRCHGSRSSSRNHQPPPRLPWPLEGLMCASSGTFPGRWKACDPVSC